MRGGSECVHGESGACIYIVWRVQLKWLFLPRLVQFTTIMASSRFSHVFLLFAVFACSLASPPTKREAEETPAIAPEEACLAAGGHCVHTSKCPADKVSAQAECTLQKDLGAVCCHSIHAPGETACEKLAGECMVDCPSNLTVTQAQNCPQGEVCCTLV